MTPHHWLISATQECLPSTVKPSKFKRNCKHQFVCKIAELYNIFWVLYETQGTAARYIL